MDTIRKALAVAMKDLQVVLKDRGYVIPMILVPLAVGLFSAATFGGDGGGINMPVVVVNQDSGGYGETIVDVMAGIDEIGLEQVSTQAAAEERVVTGETMAAVILPADLTQNIIDYQPSEILVILDPAQAEYGRILTTILEEIAGSLAIQGEIRYGIQEVLADAAVNVNASPQMVSAAQAQVEGVLFTQLARMESDNPILVSRETLSGPHVFVWENVFSLVLPSFTVMFAFFIVPALSTHLIREREFGSLRRLVAAPLPRASLIGGKVLAYTLMVLIQVSLLFGTGTLLLDMPLGDSPLGLVLVSLGMALCATTLGMLVAAFARSEDQASSISMLLIFGLGFLGGSFDPVNAMYRGEGFMATLSGLTPQANASLAFQQLMVRHGLLVDVLPQLGILYGVALLFFVVAVLRFRYDA